MKGLIIAAAGLLTVSPVVAQQSTSVRGHVRSDGTYVQPHMRTTPNSSLSDNWSTRSNVNPYTGKAGTVDPYKAPTNSLFKPYGSSRRR